MGKKQKLEYQIIKLKQEMSYPGNMKKHPKFKNMKNIKKKNF